MCLLPRRSMRRWTQDCIVSNMDWKPGGVSDDVEDRRDSSGGGGGFSGMGFGAPHIGIGGHAGAAGPQLGVSSQSLHAVLGRSLERTGRPLLPLRQRGDQSTEVQFVSFVLDDVQGTWQNLLPAQGNRQYRHAKLVLYPRFDRLGLRGRRRARPGRSTVRAMKRCIWIWAFSTS